VSRGAAPRFIFRNNVPQYDELQMSDQSDFGEEGENCGLLPICDALKRRTYVCRKTPRHAWRDGE
jgi:hypothetical protein